MSAMTHPIFGHVSYAFLSATYLEVFLKGVLVLAVAGVLAVIWPKGSAACRHVIWLLGMAALPILLILGLIIPAHRPLAAISTEFNSGNEVSISLSILPSLRKGDPANHASPVSKRASLAITSAKASAASGMSARFNRNWVTAALVVWTAGLVATLGSLLAGLIALATTRRTATRFREERSLSLLDNLRADFGIARRVNLLSSDCNPMPVTWGIWRPIVLLPQQAQQWTEERRRVVLLHELAHIKRWDCLTQTVARLIAGLFWPNPLCWLALRRMCIERERACDDLVLDAGSKATEYAGHLVEIARTFRPAPRSAGIAMARSAQLGDRVEAIVDSSRSRRLSSMTVILLLVLTASLVAAFGQSNLSLSRADTEEIRAQREQQIQQLERFSAAKEQQSLNLAAAVGERISVIGRRFFTAANNGDWQTVTNLYVWFKHHHPQYEHPNTNDVDESLSTSYWSPVLEICLAYDHVVNCDPKYTAIFVNNVMQGVPAGSIFFGGTDPGRGLPTAFSKSHAEGDPFFTVTQNALADGTYLDYLRTMYGSQTYTPSAHDSQRCFQEYSADAQKRLLHDQESPGEPKQVRPGEDIRMSDGRFQVRGQVAVMSINALLAKIIFDRNPTREFYIEESFPLDWMYPHLEPHGIIMKINREALPTILEETVLKDREYWSGLTANMVGDWLQPNTPAATVAAFAEKVYVQKDLSSFKGDLRFIQNDYSKRMFSKLRSSIGGVYSWRAEHATTSEEKIRMAREAEFAFQQAFAMCPDSPEAVYRYVNLLLLLQRPDAAIPIVQAACDLNEKEPQFKQLLDQLRALKKPDR